MFFTKCQFCPWAVKRIFEHFFLNALTQRQIGIEIWNQLPMATNIPNFQKIKKISHSSNSAWDIQSERDGPLTSSLKIQWYVHTYLLARPCIYVLILNLNKQFFETLQALVCGPDSLLGTSYDLLFDMMACIAYVLKHLIVCSHTLLTHCS